MPAKRHGRKKHFQPVRKPEATGAPATAVPPAEAALARKPEAAPSMSKKAVLVSAVATGHTYVMGELARIAVLSAVIVIILIILALIFK